MCGKSYECKPLQWDTDYFGITAARVNLVGVVDKESQEKILEFCKNYQFVTLFNHNNLKQNNYWLANKTNAFLTDVNIQFHKVIVSQSNFKVESTYVMNCYPRNEQIINIARKSYLHSRFFNDPMLPYLQAKNIYLHWTECAFNRDSKYFIVCERKGKIAGYILFSVKNNDAIIELIAVDDKYQRQGVGQSLIQKMESFSIGRKINKITVGTQVNNISAARFYNTMGFTYVSCGSVYHLWRR